MSTIELRLLTQQQWFEVEKHNDRIFKISQRHGFDGGIGQWLWCDFDEYSEVIFIHDPEEAFWQYATLPINLPNSCTYVCNNEMEENVQKELYLAWQLATYQFDRFLSKPKKFPRLEVIYECEETKAMASSICKVRDWINAPAESLGPQNFVELGRQCANIFQADFKLWKDEKLRKEFPLIDVVGRASDRAPALIQLQKLKEGLPSIVLVGKGVCFDSGGLDIKPSNGMRWMKKDMGGAAHVLGLAYLIWQMDLPVSLTVLIPTVDNAISGNSFRPGDVFVARDKTTVEIGNTDAEGRLILADVLSYGSELKPDMMIDFATLTGAARVAMGADFPCFFSNNDKMRELFKSTGEEINDHVWPLPLWQSYRKLLRSTVADISSTGSSPLGGAITAALFLEHFVKNNVNWMHIDLNAFNVAASPGRPEGGEAMGFRAVYTLIKRIATKICFV